MTLFQIMDTHPFASGLAVGMMLTFGTMLLSAGFVRLLVKARNAPRSVALQNGASSDPANTTPPVFPAAPESSPITSSDHQVPAVELPQ
jgi:hypothetical protein